MSHHTVSPVGAEFQKRSRSSRVNSRYPPCAAGRKVRIKGRFIASSLSGSLSKQSIRSSIQSANSYALGSASRSFSHTGTQMRAKCFWVTKKFLPQRRKDAKELLVCVFLCVFAPLREILFKLFRLVVQMTSGRFNSEMTRGA